MFRNFKNTLILLQPMVIKLHLLRYCKNVDEGFQVCVTSVSLQHSNPYNDFMDIGSTNDSSRIMLLSKQYLLLHIEVGEKL